MKKKKKNKSSSGYILGILIFSFFTLGLLTFIIYQYRESFKFEAQEYLQQKTIYHITERNKNILERHPIRGIDVSHYQEKIHWSPHPKIYEKYPIRFVFMRATMGIDGKDKQFSKNWSSLKNTSLVRGAYHYYRPNEPSRQQAENFCKTVTLTPGDLPPIVDIEQLSEVQSVERLRLGLKNWLKIVEHHYGVRPIIYSRDRFFSIHLEPFFQNYPLWMANLNRKQSKAKWDFWQISFKGKVKGIREWVDIDVFNGDEEDWKLMMIVLNEGTMD